MKRPDKKLWPTVFESMKSNNIWEFVDVPIGVKLLKSKWVFTLKKDANGNPVRYKALLIAVGVPLNLKFRQLDVKT